VLYNDIIYNLRVDNKSFSKKKTYFKPKKTHLCLKKHDGTHRYFRVQYNIVFYLKIFPSIFLYTILRILFLNLHQRTYIHFRFFFFFSIVLTNNMLDLGDILLLSDENDVYTKRMIFKFEIFSFYTVIHFICICKRFLTFCALKKNLRILREEL